ncbi:hypothetical protein ACOMHN_040885 [Nucella lapillus]
MCVCTTSALRRLYSVFLVLLVSSAVVRASSYLRAYGAKELWPYLRIRCDLHCPYGYETDVEGNYVCLCHDPCQKVRCFGRTECVVELSKLCTRDYCRPKATCKDMNPHLPFPTAQNGVFLADDASMTSPAALLPPRCRLPGRDATKSCRKLRVRWFFDDVSGSCMSFLGCKTMDNNFRGRRGCEKTCGVQSGKSKNRPHHVTTHTGDVTVTSKDWFRAQPVCSRAVLPILTGCKRPLKRWFFDDRSGACRKFRSCPAGGNNFSRKRHCKKQCMEPGRVKRKGRKNQTRTANQ